MRGGGGGGGMGSGRSRHGVFKLCGARILHDAMYMLCCSLLCMQERSF